MTQKKGKREVYKVKNRKRQDGWEWGEERMEMTKRLMSPQKKRKILCKNKRKIITKDNFITDTDRQNDNNFLGSKWEKNRKKLSI